MLVVPSLLYLPNPFTQRYWEWPPEIKSKRYGYFEIDGEGGYKSESGDVVEEDVVKVSVFTKEKDWKDRENLIVAQVKEIKQK